MAQYDGSIKIDTKLDTTGFESGLKKLKTGAAAAGAAVAAGLGAAISAGIDFESAFAGIRKTVDASEQEFAALEAGIRNMALQIPQSASALASIGEAAGQLGIKTENIEKFTEVMANLGVATNMTSEQAATDLARIANITGMSQENFDRMGATIVALGNNLATTESEIVSMSLRLAGAGNQVGMTEAQILSFSGALSSVGIEAEAGGTAFSKLMSDMQLATVSGGESLQNFATVAGVSAQEFKAAFEQDAAGAITLFIEGLSKSEERGKTAIQVLDEMGITEIRMRDALLRAAGASDVFTKAVETGTEAWEENTALTKEAEQRYATMESQLQLLKNNVVELGITIYQALDETMGDAVKTAVDAVSDLTKALKNGQLKSAIQSVGQLFGNLVQILTRVASVVIPAVINVLAFLGDHLNVILPLVTGFAVAMKTWSIVQTVTKLLQNGWAQIAKWSAMQIAATAATTANTAAESANTAAKVASATATSALSVKTTLATATQWAWNAALSANPIGLVITLVAALAAGIAALTLAMGKQKTESQELSEAVREQKQAYDDLKATQEQQAVSDLAQLMRVTDLKDELLNLADANGRVDQANRGRAEFILGELNNALGTEYQMVDGVIQKYGELTGTIDQVIQKKKAEILLNAYAPVYEEAIQKVTEAKKAQASTLEEIHDKEKEIQDLESRYGEKIKNFYPEIYRELENLRNQYQENADTVQQCSNDIVAYESASAASVTGDYETVINTLDQVGNSYKIAADVAGESAQKQKEILGQQFADAVLAAEVAQRNYNNNTNSFNKEQLEKAKTHAANMKKEYEAVGGQIVDGCVTGMDGKEIDLTTRSKELAKSGADSIFQLKDDYVAAGANSGDGVAEGIYSKIGKVWDAAYTLGKTGVNAYNAGQDAHSPAKEYEKASENTIDGLIQGLEENKRDLIRSFLNINEEMLDSERLYIEEKERLESEEFDREYNEKIKNAKDAEEVEKIKQEYLLKAQKEGQERYLDALQAAAEAEKEAREAEKEALEQYKDDVREIYADIAKYAQDRIDEVTSAQEKLEQKLQDFGSLTQTLTFKDADGNTTSVTQLYDPSRDIKTMEQYRDSLLAVKSRLDTVGVEPEDVKDFFAIMADMGVAEGLEFANLLLGQTDEAFTKYIRDWAYKQDLAGDISEALYSDDRTEAIDDSLDYMKQELEAFGLEVPDTFSVSGTLSAEKFGESFVAELNQQMAGIREKIASFSAGLVPLSVGAGTLSAAAVAGGGSVVYNTNYTFASSNEPVSQQIRTARNAETIRRFRGE